MQTRLRGIMLFAALSLLVGWAANPATGVAQGYCYQVLPAPVFNFSLLPYPTYYGYTQPVPVLPAPSGYYVASPAPGWGKYKHWRRHKYKHRHRHGCD